MDEHNASVVELVTALPDGTLDLQAVLAELERRGALSDDECREGMETAWRMHRERNLDENTVTTLVGRLQAMRKPATDEDATVVMPPRAAAIDDEITRVQPGTPSQSDSDAGTGTTTGTGTTSSLGTSSSASWQRLAQATGEDHAEVGTLLKGRFLLEREIGRGGMGVVYLARDERKVEARDRDPWVAVKVLSDEFRRHPDSLIALQREARRSQLLAHDNIVRVFDFDKDRTLVFMTMEYIDGCDLKTLIREQAYNGMPLPKARPLIEGMARALARAHAAGIVHSDFKPANVMVTREGVAKVFDFGIARAGKHAADVSGEQTVFDAATLGALTPAYASLEMIHGQEPSTTDDIYALGCVCFELLTGRHPFDKLSAEAAQREGRKPPPVSSVTRRQYQTLCAAVAFDAEHRLKHVEELIDGLREIPLRERMLPLLIYTGLTAVIIGAGGWTLARYVHQRTVQQVTARFGADDPQRYTSEAEAMAGLEKLNDDERRTLLVDRSDLIQGFLQRRIDELWNPQAGRFDYPGVQDVFAFRDRLKLFSPQLDELRGEVEQQRNAVLNQLDSELDERIDAGQLFGDQPDGIESLLATVRKVDPDSSLLHHPALEQAYDRALEADLQSGDLTVAANHLAQAQAVFPDSLSLQRRAAQLESAQAEAVAAQTSMDTDQARARLQQLLASPSLSAQWHADLQKALAVLGPDAMDAAQRQAMAQAVVEQASHAQTPADLVQANALVGLCLKYAPDQEGLKAQQQRLHKVEADLNQKIEQEQKQAEIAARVASFHRAIAANDTDKARKALDRLRELQPDHPLLKKEGPKQLVQAYQNRVRHAFEQGNWQSAAQAAGAAADAVKDDAGLQQAAKRYAVMASIMQIRALPLDERKALRQQLEAATAANPAAMADMESALKRQGALPEGSLKAHIEANMGTDGGDAVDKAVTPSKASGGAPSGAAKGKRSAKTGYDDAEEPLPPVPDGPDPCSPVGRAGRAKPCYDMLGDKRGPMLVVIPGIAGGKPYALSRGEIAVSDFNLFCQDSGKCSPRPAGDPGVARAPIRNIGLPLARAYMRWLIVHTGGWRYRLPTDAEWQHAASAGSNWGSAEDSNCIPPGSAAGDAVRAPVAIRGRSANPWGLVNLTGNVWEWVTTSAGVAVRGGSFNSYWSDCNTNAKRSDNGSAQADVGFRILRELK